MTISAQWNCLKQNKSRHVPILLNQIQALRLAGARKALAKGQLQTFSMLLKDLGAVIGEVEPLNTQENAPNAEHQH